MVQILRFTQNDMDSQWHEPPMAWTVNDTDRRSYRS